jgi:mRNA interferase MazF
VYGKPQPALIIQSDLFDALGSVTVLPITSERRLAPLLRIPIEPTPDNGLRKKSQIMIDRIQTVPRDKIGSIVGTLGQDSLVEVNRSLATFLGIG